MSSRPATDPPDPEGAGTVQIRTPTLASVVARRLEDEVVGAGWPVGRVLGSETELLDRFGVSRAVLREAVRIMEHTGSARMRRGAGGGLVVVAPSRDAVVSASNVWFSYVGATMEEMMEIRAPLFTAACGLAAERGTESGGRVLIALAGELADALAAGDRSGGAGRPRRPSLGDIVRVERQISVMTGNSSLALFCDALADLGINRLRGGWGAIHPQFTGIELTDHVGGYVELAHHVAAGAGRRAEAVAGELLDVSRRRVVDLRAQRRPQRPRVDGKLKMAERVAAAIRDDIEHAGWRVGSVVGSEADLIERHGVSRAIAREAVRILEHHNAVRTKRGPHGGIFVAAPDAAALRQVCRLYLEYEGVTAGGLAETRSVVETAMSRLAAERASPVAGADLRSVLDAEAQHADAATTFLDLHKQIALTTGNRLLVLFVEVLADLVPPRLSPGQRTAEGMAAMSEAAHRAHVRIVEAVAAGDAGLAGRRMRRHLEASAAHPG